MELKCESKKDVCRCCLSEGVLKNLYECYVCREIRVVYSDLLQECFGIQLNSLPETYPLALNTICEECIKKLKDANNFKMQVLKCDAEFKELYKDYLKHDEIIVTVNKEENFESNTVIHDSILLNDDTLYDIKISDVKAVLDDDETISERKKNSNEDELRLDDKIKYDDEIMSDFDEDDTKLKNYLCNDMKPDDEILNVDVPIFDKQQTQIDTNDISLQGKVKRRQITVVNAPIDKVKCKTVFLDNIPDVAEDTPKVVIKRKYRPITVSNAPNRRPPINEDKLNHLSILPLLLRKDIQIRRITANEAPSTVIPFQKVNCENVSETKQGLVSNTTIASQSMNEPHVNTKPPNKRKVIPQASPKRVRKRITVAKDASTIEQDIKILKPRDPAVIKKGVDFVVNNNIYECCKCGRTSRTRDYIRAHIKLHHLQIFRYKCSNCPLIFPTESHRVNHKITEHDIDDRVTCNACNKKFNTQHHLNKHLNSFHKLGIQEKCTKCDFVGNSMSLKRHIITHKIVRDCLCTLCGKSFKDKKYLKIHQRIHAGDKRHVCKVCGQDFVQSSSLSYHMKRHHPDLL